MQENEKARYKLGGFLSFFTWENKKQINIPSMLHLNIFAPLTDLFDSTSVVWLFNKLFFFDVEKSWKYICDNRLFL